MTKERNNPWAGLASYEDPAKSERKLKFCGRDNDIYDVTRLIDDNLLLILYGKSGIGKTSLLNAGVFPELRKEQYLPVSIRLGTLEVSASYQEAIVYAIEKAIEEAHGSITVYHVVEEQTDNHQSDLLWNYFARHRFANAEGQPLFPVVVLDQFEEVLRNNSPEHVCKAQTILNQLQYLIDESHALNDCVVDGQDYFYDFNFRFIISIREDELYLLEDNIDDLSLSMFRNCRYRLRSLSEQGATEAILLPGKDCIVEEQKQAVVDRVIELSKRPESNDIDTLLLSLVCAGTYDKKVGDKITISDLAVWKSNPMEVYYQDAVKGLPADHVRYIQQHLIREDGSRRRVDAEEVKTALGEITYRQLTQGKNRLFAIGDKGQVELLHDQLALAVYEDRKNEEEKERKRKKRQKQIRNAGIIVLLALLVIFIVTFIQFRQLRWKMLENQSRFIAEKVKSIAKDQPELATLLALEVLPKDLKHPDRPYTEEAELALNEALSNLFENTQTIQHRNDVNSASYSKDGCYIVSTTNDSVIIWDSRTYHRLRSFYHPWAKDAVFSPDGNAIASAGFDSIMLWNLSDGSSHPIRTRNKVNFTVCFSSDGKQLISAGYGDSSVHRWDVETGSEILPSLCGHLSSVRSAVYSPDYKLIASASDDGTIRIWNAKTGSQLQVLIGHTKPVLFASFSPDCKQIVSSSLSDVRIWDIETGELLQIINQESYYSTFSPNGKLVFVGGYGKTKIWDIESGSCIGTFEGGPWWIHSISFSQDNQTILTADEKSVRLWNTKTTIEKININGSCRAMNPDGKLLCCVDDSLCSIINIETGHHVSLKDWQKNDQCEFRFSPDSKYLVSSSFYLTQVWNVTTGDCVRTWENPKHQNARYGSVFYSSTGKHFALYVDKSIYLLNFETGDSNLLLELEDYIGYATFTPDEKHISIVSCIDSIGNHDYWKLYKLNIESGACTQIMMKTSKNGTRFIISPNGKYIAITNFIGSDKVYLNNRAYPINPQQCGIFDYETGDMICYLKDYYFWQPLSFSPDGKLLLTMRPDHSIQLYDIKTACRIRSLETEHWYNCVGFIPNGEKIITYSSENTLCFWETFSLQDLIDQTRERFKDRLLTAEERRMYYLE